MKLKAKRLIRKKAVVDSEKNSFRNSNRKMMNYMLANMFVLES